MKIYLDACALNRLTDDQGQARIRAEAEAVAEILTFVRSGQLQWIGSEPLEVKLRRNPDLNRREQILALLHHTSYIVPGDEAAALRTRALVTSGYGSFDALHLACAESAEVLALLTTDDRFIRLAERGAGTPKISVVNPIQWLERSRPWLRKTK
ncbi:MAG: PIN domain-containing protein [Acidobacteria bacterium]|nr:PIN domain-containing protein [Acidobacteriota bacterium]